ncbi:hypothetical protein BU16DRAFT_545273 [Lophium mytilinum]|uniref:Uncharacterized protein n=1 Tax=Lophium mytilinum TaxID=390894 RepID=A0A6A6Q8J6_9PEZI|nr:hypothetical protein BU16DRAFT_545273 [Lophium mytilinum]
MSVVTKDPNFYTETMGCADTRADKTSNTARGDALQRAPSKREHQGKTTKEQETRKWKDVEEHWEKTVAEAAEREKKKAEEADEENDEPENVGAEISNGGGEIDNQGPEAANIPPPDNNASHKRKAKHDTEGPPRKRSREDVKKKLTYAPKSDPREAEQKALEKAPEKMLYKWQIVRQWPQNKKGKQKDIICGPHDLPQLSEPPTAEELLGEMRRKTRA